MTHRAIREGIVLSRRTSHLVKIKVTRAGVDPPTKGLVIVMVVVMVLVVMMVMCGSTHSIIIVRIVNISGSRINQSFQSRQV